MMIITSDTYLERIEGHYDPGTLADIIHASTVTAIRTDPIPPELAPLRPNGFTNLHFEYYGLPDQELEALYRAWVGHGVRVPGAPYKLRAHMSLFAFVEPDDGIGPLLPSNWKECLQVEDRVTHFVGRRLVERRWSEPELEECHRKWGHRPHDYAKLVAETTRREETPDGWILPAS